MMPRRRQANIKVTHEMLHNMLCLQDNLYLENVVADPFRKIVNFIVSSDLEEFPLGEIRTFDRGEGQEMILQPLEFGSAMIERMRRTVQDWDEQHAEESAQTQSREAMHALYDQMRSNR